MTETKKHADIVAKFMIIFAISIIQRASKHDKSKMQDPELAIFDEYTKKLSQSTYGSDEYNQFLKDMKPALDHHYANNRHHPEHFKNGIDDMTLVDVIEMLADWKAATMRHNDGDIIKSISYNTKRFNLSLQLVNIFKNTIAILEE